jgi:hypothetical protein
MCNGGGVSYTWRIFFKSLHQSERAQCPLRCYVQSESVLYSVSCLHTVLVAPATEQ